jgi:hypothetical protein
VSKKWPEKYWSMKLMPKPISNRIDWCIKALRLAPKLANPQIEKANKVGFYSWITWNQANALNGQCCKRPAAQKPLFDSHIVNDTNISYSD